jgi:hypothetical protein
VIAQASAKPAQGLIESHLSLAFCSVVAQVTQVDLDGLIVRCYGADRRSAARGGIA